MSVNLRPFQGISLVKTAQALPAGTTATLFTGAPAEPSW